MIPNGDAKKILRIKINGSWPGPFKVEPGWPLSGPFHTSSPFPLDQCFFLIHIMKNTLATNTKRP